MSDDTPELLNMTPVNNDRSASEVGLQAVSDGAAEDSFLDTSYQTRGQRAPTGNLGADVMGNEAGANRVVVNMKDKISAIMAEGDDGSLGMGMRLTEEDMMLPHEKQRRNLMMMNQYQQQQQSMMPQQMYPQGGMDMNAMMPQQPMQPMMPQQPQGGMATWMVQEAEAKLRSGKTVPVWMVSNVDGFEHKKAFRIEEAAGRVAAILNQTGNMHDPRIQNIMEAHDSVLKLRQEGMKVKRAIQEGRSNLKPKLQEIRQHLEQFNMVLGI